MSIILRDYQKESVERIINLKEGDRKILYLPTGLGKTVVMAALAKENLNSRILIVVPSTELREQTIDKLKVMCGENVSVGSVQGKLNEIDKNIIVATRQSLTHSKSTRIENILSNGSFEYILLDECHQALSQIKTIVNKIGFNSKVIGFTATPFNKDMLNIFQGILYQKPLLDSILEGYLCEPRCYKATTYTDISNVKSVGGEFIQSQLSKAVDNDERNYRIVKAYKDIAMERKHTLIFAASIEHASSLAYAFNSSGITAKSIDSTLDEEERRKTLKDFESGKIKVLTNVGVLTTGYDFTAIDCIIMARPTKSRILYTQCIGRGLRLDKNKADLLIIDIADISGKFSLWNMNTIFDTEFKDGESITENIERLKNEEEEERLRLEKEKEERERIREEEERLKLEEIELFNSNIDNAIKSSNLDWWKWCYKKLDIMVLSLSTNEEKIIIKMDKNLFKYYSHIKGVGVELIEESNNLMQLVSDIDESSLEKGSSYIRKYIPWKMEKATEKQKQYVKSNYYNKDRMTKWDVQKFFTGRNLYFAFKDIV